jgi:ketosteroid isomerase-like protein
MAASSPEDRIELLRRGFEAWDAGDIEAVLELLDPDVEVVAADGFINAGTHRGHDGFLRWAQQWFEAWEDFQQTPEAVVAVGDRHAVARFHQVGRGRGSGVEVEMVVGWTLEYRDGRFTYLALHLGFEDAVRDARAREGIGDGERDDDD